MAVSAKSSGFPHSLGILNSQFPWNHTPKRLTFSSNLKPNQISSKNTQEISVLTASSVNTNNNTNEDLCRLCLQGEFKKALSLLDSMEELSIAVEEEAYVALVRLCEWKRGHEEGDRIYSYIRNSFTLFSVRLGNALLSMFVRFGNLVNAWYVFGKMEERNLFSWNVLLGGYAKAGFFDEALNLYHRMLWVGIRPDVYTFPCVLRMCGGFSNLAIGRETHVHVLRFGFESDIDVNNALITMYVKCGDLDTARLVFDKMTRRDGISWNAVISGCFENGECLEGFRLFLAMMNLSVAPNLMTMTSLISACELVTDERLGKEIHAYAIKMEFVKDVPVSNSLVQLYSSVGYLDEAEKVFSRIEFKDVVSWTTMISGYDNNNLPGKAIETYETMELEGIVSPDEITITSAVSACACLGDLKTGTKLHDLANRTGFIHYVSLANTLVDMYSKCKQAKEALEVFHRIRCKDVISWTSIITGLRINQKFVESLLYFRQMILAVKPNSITLLAAISACARIGALTLGKEIHAHALRTGVAFEGFLPNSLLDMYVRCGRLTPAMNQFRSNEKDVSAWNIMLTWHAQRRQGELALDLFHRMVDDAKVDPDEITFTVLLRAFSRSGMVSKGLEYFEAMQCIYSIAPNPRHYACVVDLLGRAGRLDEAHEFILAMPMSPDAVVWGALLNSCRIHRRVELGELAARRIFETDEESVVSYYMLLSKLYADSGKWDEVTRLRWSMRERGLTVDPGCSWVEVKGKVHAFLSGDETHPRKKEIEAVMEGFQERMKGETVKESAKAEIFCGHSEGQAVAFGLISTAPGTPIWVTKNLYMCRGCHDTMKFISSVVRRDISVRDAEELHSFKDGVCSCGDEGYWGSRSDK